MFYGFVLFFDWFHFIFFGVLDLGPYTFEVTRTFLLCRVCLFVSPLSVKTLFQALSL